VEVNVIFFASLEMWKEYFPNNFIAMKHFCFLFFGTLLWFSSSVGPSNLRLKNQTQLGLQTQEELKMISYI
jgi:hypothetical protein